jgi:hypothetical protein
MAAFHLIHESLEEEQRAMQQRSQAPHDSGVLGEDVANHRHDGLTTRPFGDGDGCFWDRWLMANGLADRLQAEQAPSPPKAGFKRGRPDFGVSSSLTDRVKPALPSPRSFFEGRQHARETSDRPPGGVAQGPKLSRPRPLGEAPPPQSLLRYARTGDNEGGDEDSLSSLLHSCDLTSPVKSGQDRQDSTASNYFGQDARRQFYLRVREAFRERERQLLDPLAVTTPTAGDAPEDLVDGGDDATAPSPRTAFIRKLVYTPPRGFRDSSRKREVHVSP